LYRRFAPRAGFTACDICPIAIAPRISPQQVMLVVIERLRAGEVRESIRSARSFSARAA
jgi:hypothetical protein